MTPHTPSYEPGIDEAVDSVSEMAERLAAVRARIEAAARRAGRDPQDITLVGVAKTFPPEVVQAAIAAGLRDIGENRVQEARDKKPAVLDLSGEAGQQTRWHLIGHLQTNKVNMAMRLFDVFHSWDRLSLMEAMSRRAEREGRIIEGFVQVNIGREPNKSGVDPDELFDLLEAGCRLPGLRVLGLMAIPPMTENPEDARPYFRQLRELSEEARAREVGGFQGKELSMGMTNDFEAAIEEGATVVRVGRALFGDRP